MNIPGDRKYTKSHEWVKLEGDLATIGITDFAQSELGDVVYIDLPSVGRSLRAGDSFGSVESVKTVSEVYTPIGGIIAEVNESLGAQSERLNSDPYEGGWMVKIRINNPSQAEELLDDEGYRQVIS